MIELAVAWGLGFLFGAWTASYIWRGYFQNLIIAQIISKEREEKLEDKNNLSSQTVEETPVRGSGPNGGSKRGTIH